MEISDFIRDTWQTSLVFITLFIFTRLLDKTQVGQLTFYEYVSGITMGSIAGTIVGGRPDEVWNHFYDLILFILLTYILSVITIKSRPLRKLIQGTPSIIIENGRIIKENMKPLRFDIDELNAQLRVKGILDISEVQYAILEATGEMSIIKKPDNDPLTRSDMSIHLPNPKLPVELIMDGEIITENLNKKNLTEQWLDDELSKQNIFDRAKVMYAVIDSKGQLFVSSKGSKTN